MPSQMLNNHYACAKLGNTQSIEKKRRKYGKVQVQHLYVIVAT